MNAHYVYVHKRRDTGVVFYVGMGHGKRAHQTRSRGYAWSMVQRRCGRPVVEIVQPGLTRGQAAQAERQLIGELRAKGAALINVQDGGANRRIAAAEVSRLEQEALFAMGLVDADGWAT